jgi:hypothetical protein
MEGTSGEAYKGYIIQPEGEGDYFIILLDAASKANALPGRTFGDLQLAHAAVDALVQHGQPRFDEVWAKREELASQLVALKRSWELDPCYDLEMAPGFEMFEEELRTHRLQREMRRREAREEMLREKAELIGCPGNVKLAEYVLALENRIETLTERFERHLEGAHVRV